MALWMAGRDLKIMYQISIPLLLVRETVILGDDPGSVNMWLRERGFQLYIYVPDFPIDSL